MVILTHRFFRFERNFRNRIFSIQHLHKMMIAGGRCDCLRSAAPAAAALPVGAIGLVYAQIMESPLTRLQLAETQFPDICSPTNTLISPSSRYLQGLDTDVG